MGTEVLVHPELDEFFVTLRKNKEEVRLRKAKVKLEAATSTTTIGAMQYALVKFRGNIAQAAKFLSMSRGALSIRVRNTPSLDRLVKDIREENLDIVEFKNLESAIDGNVTAQIFILKTLGKDRGYSEKVVMTHEVGERTSAALIAAMRNGARLSELMPPKEEIVEVEDYTWEESESPLESEMTS